MSTFPSIPILSEKDFNWNEFLLDHSTLMANEFCRDVKIIPPILESSQNCVSVFESYMSIILVSVEP